MADTPDLPPLPSHPDSHTMAWTDREKAAIADYAREAVRLAARSSVPASDGWITSPDRLSRRLAAPNAAQGIPIDMTRTVFVGGPLIDNVTGKPLLEAFSPQAKSAPTPPDEATSRAQFEAWFRKGDGPPEWLARFSADGSYIDSVTRQMWGAWHAARTQGDGA